MLTIDHIDVFHGTFQALWDICMEVQEGEMLALIGANTAGKTTLLDTICGLLHPAQGSIRYDGQEISHMDAHRIVEMGITQVPEGRRIFPEMSVLDNLVLGSYNQRARRKQAENLQLVFKHFPELKKRSKQIAKTLSGGEQQMLAIGRGLMADPRLMLIDELSLGLAPIVIDEIFVALKQIQQHGITILFVEQNVRRTLKEADRAYILETGKVTLSGTSAALRENREIKRAYFGVATAGVI